MAKGDLFHDTQTAEEFKTRVVQLHGVGEWTAEYIAMRAFGEADAFPASDLGVRKALTPIPKKHPKTGKDVLIPVERSQRVGRKPATLSLLCRVRPLG